MKIALRKKRPDKITKYEKKIQEFSNILAGGGKYSNNTNNNLKDEAIEKNDEIHVENDNKIPSFVSRVVASSDVAFHLGKYKI